MSRALPFFQTLLIFLLAGIFSVSAARALTHTTVTEHDAAGQKRFVTNRNAKVYEMTYDALGRTKQTIQPGGRTLGVVYAWNATGRTETLTEPSSQVTTLQYDKLGRLKTRTGPDSTTSYGYDPSGNLLTVTEGAAVLTRTYEPTRDLVSTYTNVAGDVIGYTYDANGNLSTLTYPGGKTVTYGYDTNDRMVKVTDWSGRITKMGYDLSGRLTSIKRPNGTTRRMTYDAAGQMTSFTEVRPRGELIASQSWRYDAGGRPEKRFRSPGATAFTPPSYTATYHPDNRMNTVTPGGGSSATVVSDLDGNMTSVPLWEPSRAWAATVPSWDARNRLTGITTANATASYAYDAEGNLVSRTQGGQTTRYTVDPGGALSQQLIEHRPDGSKTFYVYGPGLLYEEGFNAAGASLATRSYHYDQVGSTIALSDASGVVTGRLEYTAYGVTSYTSGMVDTKFRYVGSYGVQTDLGTGLLQMRARWYSPSLGRFLCEDPIGFGGGMNWFAYADGNPISLSDPFGLCAESQSAYILRTVGPEPVGFWNNLKGALTGDMHAREAAAAEWNTANNKQDGFASFQKGMAVGADVSGIATAGLIGARATSNGPPNRFSGPDKAWAEGATPNSSWTQIHPDMPDKAIQTTIYNGNGSAIGQVDWKPQHGQGSGHGHGLTTPGDFSSGHQGNGVFYPPGQLPAGWGTLPKGVGPIKP